MKIALSNTFRLLTSSFFYLTSCFPKEPEQDSREECRVPGSSIMGQTTPPAAAWFGALSALQSQASFSRAVCAHLCRPACSWSNYSTEQQRTQEKLPQKGSISEWAVPESRILLLVSGWKALMNSPVTNDTVKILKMFCTFGGGTNYFTGAVFQWKYALYRPDTRQLCYQLRISDLNLIFICIWKMKKKRSTKYFQMYQAEKLIMR